jgi:hypothetical protein
VSERNLYRLSGVLWGAGVVVTALVSLAGITLIVAGALLAVTVNWATEGTLPASEVPTPEQLQEARLDAILKAFADVRPSYADPAHPAYDAERAKFDGYPVPTAEDVARGWMNTTARSRSELSAARKRVLDDVEGARRAYYRGPTNAAKSMILEDGERITNAHSGFRKYYADRYRRQSLLPGMIISDGVESKVFEGWDGEEHTVLSWGAKQSSKGWVEG